MLKKCVGGFVLILSILVMFSYLNFIPSVFAQSDLRQNAVQAFQNFTSMGEQERMNAASKMSPNERAMIMMGAAQMTQTINETIAGMSPSELQKATIYLLRYGNFTSEQNDTTAMGLAKILSVNDNEFLRFENFMITNGPDLHVYFTNGKDTKSGMDLGALKGNVGPQNYFLGGIANKYDTIVIASKPFGTVFASSSLKS
ncbi:MAG: DM13 domain-containing protein [Nitrososphaeraceae archaeon]